MKKYILKIIIGIIIIIVVALFSFRHIIIGNALKITISKKTNETVSLNIGNVYYDILNSSVSFSNSELLFRNTFINKEKTIEFSELRFNEIKINNLSIIRLLFKREVVANKIIIDKPSLWFKENHNPKPFKEKPKEIINSLKQHHDILKNLVVIVNEIEITHGKIDLKSLINNTNHNVSLEFKLLLEKVNTSKDNNFEKDKILFAKEHFVKLSKFNYTLPNGDKISFDSIVFDSKSNNLITSNLEVSINNDSAQSKINSLTAKINNILLSGIGFEAIEDLHNLEFDKITLSDGYIHLTENNTTKPYKPSGTSSNKKDIFKKIHKLKLNLFALNNINLLNTEKSGDTIIDLKNLNFSVNNIQIDSTILITKIPNIDFNSIVVSSGELKIFEKKSGLNIKLNNIKFTEEEGIISLSNLQIGENKQANSQNFMVDVASIGISGVSAKEILVGNSIKIGLDISSPLVDIDLLKKLNSTTKKKKLNLDNIEISEVNISNGNIHIFENNKLDINIDNLNFNSGIIQLKDFSKLHEINSDNFVLSTSLFNINLIEKDIFVSVESVVFFKNSFRINNVSTNVTNPNSINTSVTIGQIDFEGTNIKEIINNKTINLNKFIITKPKIEGNLVTHPKSDKTNNKQQLAFDYKININDFEIQQGNINLDINHKGEQIKLKTGVDILVDNIFLNNSNDTTWLNRLMWNINLSEPTIHYKDYIISCTAIKSDNAKELLTLKNIKIHDNINSKMKNGVDIQTLTVENIALSGLKYNTIINKQRPVVNSIIIKKPYLDLTVDTRNKKQTKPKGQLNKKDLPFEIEDFEILNLSFKIEKIDSISTSNISLGNLNFKYNMSVTNDLINGFEHFSATDFLLLDSTKNSFYDIKNLIFEKQDNEITISGIKGGSLNKQLKDKNYLLYSSSGLTFKGLDVTQTYPHNITIKEIALDDFDINLVNHKKAKTSTKPTAKKKIKLPSLINSLKIDAITGNSINVTHQTITDTTEKKLALNNLGFIISSIKIDSNTINNTNFRFIENISLNLKNSKFVSKDSLYVTSINTASYNFYENRFTIDTLLMKPRYNSTEFFKKAVYQTGMMNIGVNKIICSNIRFEKIIESGNIHIGGIDTYGLDMHIFRNKKYEMDPNLYKKMPQEALLSLSKIITIDSLKTHNSYILYKQLSKKSVVPGEIFLDRVNLSVFNISNDLTVIDKTSSMVIYFNAMLLGEANTNLKMTLPILSPANDFWISGHVDDVDFTKLNSMTQNLVGVTLKRGHGEVDIPLISGNSNHSTGLIAFKYKKLKIELYDRDKAQNASGLGGSMANLLLNDILVKSNNPGFLGKTRKGDVYFVRNTQKSIVAYTWKSILSGIMSTMGYDNKEQRQEKRAIKRRNR